MTPTRPDSNICPQSPRVTRSTQISTGSPPPPPRRRNGEKPRADPSITPRKFRRFFTPRSVGNNHNSAARQALFDITNPANNRDVIQSSPIRPAKSFGGQENSPTAFTRGLKRRKIIHIQDGATEHKYSSRKSHSTAPEGDESEDGLDVFRSSPVKGLLSSRRMFEEDEDEEMLDLPVLPRRPMNRISAVADRGLAGRLYQMSLGCTSRGARRYEYPVNDWQDETQAFHSRKTDIHTNHSLESNNLCIPFSSTSCNTNTSIAVGDEEGRVRMLETEKGGEQQLKTSWLNFRVHTNAIMDMSFASDDSLLATASGDATARVVDMRTQITTAVLGNHYASLKQVRWQPGSHNILATSSRDGCIQIWDLRTTGYDGPATAIQAPVEPRHRTTIRTAARKTLFGRPVNSLVDCHKMGLGQSAAPTSAQSSDVPSQGETIGRAGDVSVTAIEFLPGEQDHILLSACEGDASVKVWDIRHVHGRRKNPTPISQTQHPSAHVGWRHFGITSMSLNTSGSRLYTLCKDNTVYAYSTAHLILGQALELSIDHEGKRLPLRATKQGLGPLYGYRHPKLHTNSFFVKSSIRKAANGKSEMLAVGSSNGNAILFPTDERYLPKVQKREKEDWSSLPQNRSGLTRVGSGAQTMNQRVAESCPISQNGTILSNGHSSEVGCLHWNTDGELVTVGDDYLVRVWREGDGARALRKGTVEAGRAGHNGWAEVSKKYDEYEDDEE